MIDKSLSVLDEIIERNRTALHDGIEARRMEMAGNNIGHLRLYELLGFSSEEGQKIDLYQNIGRCVYKYAGALIEEATVTVLQHAKDGDRLRIPKHRQLEPRQL